MTAREIVFASLALLSALGSIVAWVAKLRWAREYAKAKDETIRAREAQIDTLKSQIDSLQQLTPMKMREYFESVTQTLEEANDLLTSRLTEADEGIAQRDAEIRRIRKDSSDRHDEIDRLQRELVAIKETKNDLERIARLRPAQEETASWSHLLNTSRFVTEVEDLRQLAQREFTSLFGRDQRLGESHCPVVFALRPVGKKKWPLLEKMLGHKWNLQLYCEYPGCWHPTQKGGMYEIKQPGKWMNALSPHVRRLITVFKFATTVAPPGVGFALPALAALLKSDIALMKGLVDGLSQLDVRGERDLIDEYELRSEGGRSRVEGASLRGLRKLLDELDPAQKWGGLKKVLTPEGHYLWLCEYHAEEFRR